MDETGGVFIVTDTAQYRFDTGRGGKPKVTWRYRYDNIHKQKPGQFDAGSGTTPTLMGRHYLSIADNAARMQVVVLRRDKRLKRGQRRLVCEQPVFRKGAGATENSIIATDRSMIVENNYGYAPPPDATAGGNTTKPGVARVDVKRNGKGCRTVWNSSRDLAQHGAQAVARQRPDLHLHEAEGPARPLVPDRRRLPHRQDRLAPADREPAPCSTCTTPASRSAPAGCSTRACSAGRWASRTADARARARVHRGGGAADHHPGRRHGDGGAQRVHGRAPGGLRHHARDLRRLLRLGLRVGARRGGRARRVGDRLRRAAPGRRGLPDLAGRADACWMARSGLAPRAGRRLRARATRSGRAC